MMLISFELIKLKGGVFVDKSCPLYEVSGICCLQTTDKTSTKTIKPNGQTLQQGVELKKIYNNPAPENDVDHIIIK